MILSVILFVLIVLATFQEHCDWVDMLKKIDIVICPTDCFLLLVDVSLPNDLRYKDDPCHLLTTAIIQIRRRRPSPAGINRGVGERGKSTRIKEKTKGTKVVKLLPRFKGPGPRGGVRSRERERGGGVAWRGVVRAGR